MRAALKKKGITKVIVIPDMQCPFEDKKTMKAVEKYMASTNWDMYINLGDFLDYFVIARYNVDKPGLVEGRKILDECEHGAKVLKRHENIIKKNNPNAQLYLIEGNHEYRATDFGQKWPQLRGLIEPENVLDLTNVNYVKFWSNGETLRVGKALFVHGQATNQHHAKKMVEAYEENIFYGHTHDTNAFNKTTHGDHKTRVGQAMGCLCKFPEDVDYTKGKATNWQEAFGVFWFQPNGFFNYSLVRIYNNRFVAPDGKLYTP